MTCPSEFPALNAAQLRLLKVLGGDRVVIAHWDNVALVRLARHGLAQSIPANAATGGLSSSAIWTITERGQNLLAERAGQ